METVHTAPCRPHHPASFPNRTDYICLSGLHTDHHFAWFQFWPVRIRPGFSSAPATFIRMQRCCCLYSSATRAVQAHPYRTYFAIFQATSWAFRLMYWQVRQSVLDNRTCVRALRTCLMTFAHRVLNDPSRPVSPVASYMVPLVACSILLNTKAMSHGRRRGAAMWQWWQTLGHAQM